MSIIHSLMLLAIIAQSTCVSIVDMMNDNEIVLSDSEQHPDYDLPTPLMIRRAGYPAESHIIMTEDGYILTLHRIPGKFGSAPVLLEHGLLCSSADWVVTGKSLAYLLADQGYDVWLGNMRGNTYCRAHKTMTTSDPKFWDFSWHEIGIYDLPSTIEYIVQQTNQSLTYIGHSMGTTSFFVMASERPEILRKNRIRAMFSLAPVAFVDHMKSPVRLFAPFANDLQLLGHILGVNEFLPQNSIIKFLARYGCDIDTKEKEICENILFVLGGFDKEQFNTTTIPLILNHAPAGASTKTLVHYAQEIESAKFRQFDYGAKKNKLRYNSTEPPEYDLSKVKVPVTLFYGRNDWLASVIDVTRLSHELPMVKNTFNIDYAKWNHFDFLYGIDAPVFVYDKIIHLMQKQGITP